MNKYVGMSPSVISDILVIDFFCNLFQGNVVIWNLLCRQETDVKQTNEFGQTALHLAAAKGNTGEIFQLPYFKHLS